MMVEVEFSLKEPSLLFLEWLFLYLIGLQHIMSINIITLIRINFTIFTDYVAKRVLKSEHSNWSIGKVVILYSLPLPPCWTFTSVGLTVKSGFFLENVFLYKILQRFRAAKNVQWGYYDLPIRLWHQHERKMRLHSAHRPLTAYAPTWISMRGTRLLCFHIELS